jgi:exodeoxyribonuclease VII small subunit
MTKKSKAAPFQFETALQTLTQLVEKMEHGQLPLEESLKCYEQGIGLIRDCHSALEAAKQQVQILTQTTTGESLSDFHEPSDADD